MLVYNGTTYVFNILLHPACAFCGIFTQPPTWQLLFRKLSASLVPFHKQLNDTPFDTYNFAFYIKEKEVINQDSIRYM